MKDKMVILTAPDGTKVQAREGSKIANLADMERDAKGKVMGRLATLGIVGYTTREERDKAAAAKAAQHGSR